MSARSRSRSPPNCPLRTPHPSDPNNPPDRPMRTLLLSPSGPTYYVLDEDPSDHICPTEDPIASSLLSGSVCIRRSDTEENSIGIQTISKPPMSPPFPSGPLHTSRSDFEEDDFADIHPIMKPPMSPPIPRGPLHTTRSDSEEEEPPMCPPLPSGPLHTSRSDSEEEDDFADVHPIIEPPMSPPLPSGPLHTTRSDSEEEDSSIIKPLMSPPLPSGPLHTSRSDSEEDSANIYSIMRPPMSPPLPSGPLHTTRSDSEGEDSPDVPPIVSPPKPIKADVRGTWLRQEIEKKREEDESLGIVTDDETSVFHQEMLPNIPDGELQSWVDPIHNWEPISYSVIPSRKKIPLPSHSESDDEDDVIFVESISNHEQTKDEDKKAMVHLSDFVVEFKEEVEKLPAIFINCYQLSNEEKNEQVRLLDDKDEVVVVIGRYMVRTTKEGIEKARKDWDKGIYDNISDIDEEDSDLDILDEDSENFEVEIVEDSSESSDSEVEIIDEIIRPG